MIAYFLTRALDLISTYLCFWAAGGTLGEGNAIPSLLIRKIGYGWFIPLNLIASYLAYKILKRYKAVGIFTALNMVVVIINFTTFYLTFQMTR